MFSYFSDEDMRQIFALKERGESDTLKILEAVDVTEHDKEVGGLHTPCVDC